MNKTSHSAGKKTKNSNFKFQINSRRCGVFINFAEMIRFFLGNQILSLLFLPLVIAGYSLLNTGVLGVDVMYFELSKFVDLGLWGRFELPNLLWMKWISGLLVFVNALTLNFLFNTNAFYERNSYIVSILYIVLMSFYHSFYQVDGVLIAHFWLILSLFQLFRLESNLDGRRIAFNSGFFFGLAASFHPSLIFTIPLLWIMLTRIRPFVFREILLSTAGFLVPLIYGFILIFWNEKQINWNFIETAVNYSQKQFIFLSFIFLFSISAILSIFGMRIKNAKSSIRFRKLTAIIFVFLLIGIALGTVEIIFLKQYEWFSFSMVSLALFLPFSFFHKSTNVFATLLFYVTLIISVTKFFI